MIRNFFIVAFRHITKHRGHSLINLTGLTVGLAACILISLWVRDELSYDRFHEKGDRIYRVLWEAKYGDNEWILPLVPVPVGPALTRELPQVESVSQLYSGGMTLKHGSELVREDGVMFVDSSFNTVFTIEVLEGDLDRTLSSPDMLALTRESAKKYFGDEPALGRSIEDNGGKHWQVGAIVASFPSQSHFHFDFLSGLRSLQHYRNRREQWGSASVYNYFTVRPGTNMETLTKQWNTYVQENVARGLEDDNYVRFPFQAMNDIHLNSKLEYELQSNGDQRSVVIFSIVALFILLLACINFVNLATARSLLRSKEVGIRKVLGSSRSQIIRQFFTESFLQVLVAVLLALMVVNLVMPGFNQLTDKELSLSALLSPAALGGLTAIVLITTFLTGTFPALFLSRFKPVQAMVGQIGFSGGQNWLGKTLVVAQFCISIGMIIGTVVVMQQLHYMRNQNLGFDKERVLVISRAGALGDQYDTFIDQLRQMSYVLEVARAQSLPGKENDSTIFLPEQPANYERTSLNYAYTGPRYTDLLDIEILEGRGFSTELRSDSLACLINRAAAQRLGWEQPLGRKIRTGMGEERPVVGIMDDFHYESLHHQVAPIIILNSKWRVQYIAIKLQAGNVTNHLNGVRQLWDDMTQSAPFQYSFLDQDYDNLYRSERKMGQVLSIFAGLSILIACLGLFGLASFLVTRRYKEISIRKVLGATTGSLVSMLNREFLVLVVVAFLLATPLIWWWLSRWLENFAYRIDIGWWVFLAAGTVALLIALITVSTQSIRAALADPADYLRDE